MDVAFCNIGRFIKLCSWESLLFAFILVVHPIGQCA